MKRSKDDLIDRGWHPVKVEYWCPWSKRRKDLFGFADILAIKEGTIPVLVQTTTGSNFAARRTKIYNSDLAILALKSGFRIVLHGWRQLKAKRGGKKMVWTLREEEVTLEQIMEFRLNVEATA